MRRVDLYRTNAVRADSSEITELTIIRNVTGAQRELLKYYASVTSNRWLMLKIFGVLIIFVSYRFINCKLGAVGERRGKGLGRAQSVGYTWAWA